MKKEIREVKDGIVQITTVDERWYVKALKDEEGILKVVFVPSITWIAGHYPKGIAFYKWLAGKGWDEAEALKQSALTGRIIMQSIIMADVLHIIIYRLI
jgi:hypothetical protein